MRLDGSRSWRQRAKLTVVSLVVILRDEFAECSEIRMDAGTSRDYLSATSTTRT